MSRPHINYRWFALLFVGLVCHAVQAEKATPAPSPFASVVLAHFDEWDLNHNGVLDPEELDKLVIQRGIRGDAAALGTLKSIHRSRKFQLPKLDIEFFNKYALLVSENKLNGYPPFEMQFHTARIRTGGVNQVLFPPHQPSLSAIHQGALDDCFFLAALGSMVNRDPNSVKQLINLEKNGNYSILFPGAKKVLLLPLTDAEMALTSTTEGHGIWLNIFEKAYGQLQNESLNAAKRTLSATDAICNGGNPVSALQDLTGHQVKWMDLRQPSKVPVSKEKIAEELHQLLVMTMKARRLMSANTPREVKTNNITPNHCFSVLNYNATTRTILVFNPHGKSFEPKGEPGLKNGYVSKLGRIEIPLAEFVECFLTVCYETGESIKK